MDARSLARDPASGRTLLGTYGRGLWSRGDGGPWSAVGLETSRVFRLLVTDAHVYALTDVYGVERAPLGSEDFVSAGDGLPLVSVRQLLADDAQGLWAATDAGLFTLAGDSWVAVPCEGATRLSQLTWYEDAQGRWLVAVTDAGVQRRLLP